MKIFELFGDILVRDQTSQVLQNIGNNVNQLNGQINQLPPNITIIDNSTNNINNITNNMQQLQQQTQQAQDKMKIFGVEITDGMKKAAMGVAAFASGVVAVGAGMLKMANDASEVAGRITDMSTKMGISTDMFQEWEYVLGQSGIDIGVLQGSMKGFSNQVDEASKGGEKQVEMFKRLGVSIRDQNGQLKDTETLYKETVKGLQGMGAGAEKTALASDLLGKAGTELNAVLNSSAEDFEAATKKAHELGAVLSKDAVAAGDNFGDAMADIGIQSKAFSTNIGIELIPIIQKLMDFLTEKTPAIKKWFKDFVDGGALLVQGWADTMKAVVTAYDTVSGVIIGINQSIVTGFVSMVKKTTDTLMGFVNGARKLLGQEALDNPIQPLLDGVTKGVNEVVNKHKEMVTGTITTLTNISNGAQSVLERGYTSQIKTTKKGEEDKNKEIAAAAATRATQQEADSLVLLAQSDGFNQRRLAKEAEFNVLQVAKEKEKLGLINNEYKQYLIDKSIAEDAEKLEEETRNAEDLAAEKTNLGLMNAEYKQYLLDKSLMDDEEKLTEEMDDVDRITAEKNNLTAIKNEYAKFLSEKSAMEEDSKTESTGVFDGLFKVVSDNWTGIQGLVGAAAGAIGGDVKDMYDAGMVASKTVTQAMSGDWLGAATTVLTNIDTIGKGVESFFTWITGGSETVTLTMGEQWDNLTAGIDKNFKELVESVKPSFTAIYDAMNEMYLNTGKLVVTALTDAQKYGGETATAVKTVYDESLKNVGDYIKGISLGTAQALTEIANGTSDMFTKSYDSVSVVMNSLKTIAETVWTSVSDASSEAWTKTKAATQEAIDKITPIVKSLTDTAISESDRLGTAVMTALKNRYDQEEKLSLGANAGELAALSKLVDDKKYQYNRDYMNKLASIDEEFAAELKLRTDKISDINKVTAEEKKALEDAATEEKKINLNKIINFSESEAERSKAKKELAAIEREQDKARLQAEVDGIMTTVQKKKEIAKKEFDDKTATAQTEAEIQFGRTQTQLQREADAIKAHYAQLRSQDMLEAEATRLMTDTNQKGLIDLLGTYNAKWQDAGKSFGEKLVNGFDATKGTMMDSINDVLKKVTSAREAITSLETLKSYVVTPYNGGEQITGTPIKETVKELRPTGGYGTSGITQNITLISPNATDPVEAARQLKNANMQLVMGVS